MAITGGGNVIGAEVKGWKEIQRALNDLPKKLARKVIKKAVRVATNKVLSATKAEAPRRTGLMQKAIGSRVQKKNKRGTWTMYVGWRRNMYERLRSASGTSERSRKPGVRTDYFYPAAVEFGTAKTPANPFFRRAFDSTGPVAAKMMERLLWKGIEKAVRESKKVSV